MGNDVDVQELVGRIAAEVGVDISCYAEDLGPGIHQLSIEDPGSRGAPVALIWSPGGSIVTHIGSGGARLEVPLSAAGTKEIDRVLTAVFLGQVIETVYISGADLRVRYQGDEVIRMRVRKGIFARKGKVISKRIYPSYGGG